MIRTLERPRKGPHCCKRSREETTLFRRPSLSTETSSDANSAGKISSGANLRIRRRAEGDVAHSLLDELLDDVALDVEDERACTENLVTTLSLRRRIRK